MAKVKVYNRMAIREVSLVSKEARPANQGAMALFHKVHKGDNDMTDVEKLKADLAAAEAKVAELEKALEKATGKGEGEGFMKSLDDEARAAFEKLQKENEALAKATNDLVEKAEVSRVEKALSVYEHLPIKPEEFAPIYRKLEKALEETEIAEVSRILKAADELIASGALTKEIGGPASKPSPQSAALEAKAQEIAKAEGISEAEAYAKAMRLHPDLAAEAIGPLN